MSCRYAVGNDRCQYESYTHCNEQLPVVFANVVDGADVLMVEGGGSLGLLHETLFGSGALAQVRREKFQRDGTVQAGVTGLIHNAHAATSELAEDLIVGDGFPDHDTTGASIRDVRAEVELRSGLKWITRITAGPDLIPSVVQMVEGAADFEGDAHATDRRPSRRPSSFEHDSFAERIADAVETIGGADRALSA